MNNKSYSIPFHEYSAYTKRNLLQALNEVKDGPNSLLLGICANAEFTPTGLELENLELEYVLDLLLDMFPAWDKFSGDSSYPIPGGQPTFKQTSYKWNGHQGVLRYELLDFLINSLENEV